MTKKNVTLICDKNDSLREIISQSGSINVTVTDEDNIPVDSDCILISQEYAKEKTDEIIKSAQLSLTSIGILTTDGKTKNLDRLLDAGADDIIVLPAPERIIKKRIASLCNTFVSDSSSMDFSLFDKIAESNTGRGSFVIQENDFANIYRFVMRLLERLDKKAQLLIFSVNSRFRDSFVESDVILNFASIVQTSLRRGDISSLHGRQLAVIIVGADEKDAKNVAKRLIETYYAHFDDDAYDIVYDIKEINSKV